MEFYQIMVIFLKLLSLSILVSLVSANKENASNSKASFGFQPWSNDTGEPIQKDCEAFYFQYMEYAGKFTHCELANAKPFRLCSSCVEEYTLAYTAYEDLLKDPHLEECRKKYLSADRIQILPTFQKNMEAVWTDSGCTGCSSNITIDQKTNEVTYNVPPDVLKFMHLFDNMTLCVNETTRDWSSSDWLPEALRTNTNKTVCNECLGQYQALNEQFKALSASLGSGLCMDLVDMTNYTRLNWSSTFHCSHRSGDQVPTIATTCVLCTTPFFFYIVMRLFSKQPKKVHMRQKRLLTSQDVQDSSPLLSNSYYYGSGDSRPTTLLQTIAS